MALESESDVIEHGDRAPNFELEGTDGDTHDLESFDDHDALLVVFMCNHCPYVRAKFDAMNAIAADYKDVAVVGINSNDAEEYPEDSFGKMVEYVEDGKIDITAYLRDKSQDVARAYGAVCTPDPFLFENDDDVFRLVYHGRFDDALNPDDEPSGRPGEEIRSAIESVLAGETPEAEFRPSRGCSIKWRG
ncbi:thioredoxin family protein [Natronomonas sp. F2-12]|uniref:Thioredoxin family protein n=1 Tax=Natronomonas aquatica TaxID=2841590 RepID=A0A9R1D7M6_9EURY|nr:thioredoxin family protein [Natronomonas aquatica]MCQ4333640.1 thioredoxin family protein [Natronomonas aquatica]